MWLPLKDLSLCFHFSSPLLMNRFLCALFPELHHQELQKTRWRTGTGGNCCQEKKCLVLQIFCLFVVLFGGGCLFGLVFCGHKEGKNKLPSAAQNLCSLGWQASLGGTRGAAPGAVGTAGCAVCPQPSRSPAECGGALFLTEIVVGKCAVVPLPEGLSGNRCSSEPLCPSSPLVCWGL